MTRKMEATQNLVFSSHATPHQEQHTPSTQTICRLFYTFRLPFNWERPPRAICLREHDIVFVFFRNFDARIHGFLCAVFVWRLILTESEFEVWREITHALLCGNSATHQTSFMWVCKQNRNALLRQCCHLT